ncbi:MAG: hypothetical protein KC418_19360 [Anaerolineales bacterium]|nr:hypothetical protein [Anaerolineales bacterium]
MKRHLWFPLLSIFFLALASSQAAAASADAPAATISVTTLSPGISADGACSLMEAIVNANNDAGTYADCAAGSGSDVIELLPGTYTLATPHNNTDDGTGLPVITSVMVINGHNSVIERSAAPGTPPFRLVYVNTAGNLTLNDLTLQNGSANTDGTGVGGGGVFNAGILTLNNTALLNNNSGTSGGGLSNWSNATTALNGGSVSSNTTTNAGGGIYNRSGSVTLTGTAVTYNVSTVDADPGAGGGIANHAIEGNATLTLTSADVSHNTIDGLGGGGIDNTANTGRTATATISASTITYNTANGLDHTEGLGGGIQNSFFRGTSNAQANLTIDRSTISHNSAVDGGGISSGIDLPTNLIATLSLTNSTVSYNTTHPLTGFVLGDGGGVYLVNGTATIANTTISHNEANGSGGPTDFSGFGGGVMAVGLNAASSLTLINTTIANNTASSSGGGLANLKFNVSANVNSRNTLVGDNSSPGNASCYNFQGTLTSQGNNLEDHNTCQFTQGSDKVNTNPLLGQLKDNGGPTETHALLPGSGAINAGSNAACAVPPINNLDQRGVARPQGAACDIGAYEATWAQTVLTFSTQYTLNNGTSGTGRYALLAGGVYVDENGDTGTWSFQQSPPAFNFQADPGTACNVHAFGRFVSATQLRGWRMCQDGSGVAGYWVGNKVP